MREEALRCGKSYRWVDVVSRFGRTDDNGLHGDETAMELPIICDLTPAALRARREDLLAGLAERATGHEETTDGHIFTFNASSETLQMLTAAIDAERQCCRWLRFAVTVEPDGGPITLTLSGPDGAREFLSALFASD